MAVSSDPIWSTGDDTTEALQARAEAIRRLLDEADARDAALLESLSNRYSPPPAARPRSLG